MVSRHFPELLIISKNNEMPNEARYNNNILKKNS